jgi:hypothetical protein
MNRRSGPIRSRRRRKTIATLTGGQLPGSDIRCVPASEPIALPTPDSRHMTKAGAPTPAFLPTHRL